jgi:hypothetical protein
MTPSRLEQQPLSLDSNLHTPRGSKFGRTAVIGHPYAAVLASFATVTALITQRTRR